MTTGVYRLFELMVRAREGAQPSLTVHPCSMIQWACLKGIFFILPAQGNGTRLLVANVRF